MPREGEEVQEVKSLLEEVLAVDEDQRESLRRASNAGTISPSIDPYRGS